MLYPKPLYIPEYKAPKLDVLDEETMENIRHAAEKFSVAINQVWEALKPILYRYIETISALGGDIAEARLYSNAIIWAEASHPEWTKILRRTKKTRIKKKYRKRIVREYLKQKEAEG